MKNGVNYFPLDVHLDDNFKLIEAEFGLKGFGVLIKLYQKIYAEGYFCHWDSEVMLLFAHKLGVSYGFVSEVINKSLRRGIFDKTLYDKYAILTSKGIQERYFTITKRRKVLEVKNEYLLVNSVENYQDVCKIDKNVYKNNENVYGKEQRKEKESKVKKSKVNIYKRSGESTKQTIQADLDYKHYPEEDIIKIMQ